MKRATEEILEGLRVHNDSPTDSDPVGIRLIAAGMERAGRVFEGWGLVPEEVRAQLSKLASEGIRSPRLTGAGGGGYIVGLTD
jgi:mevalonate kinase